jgi:hypothetical protein
MMTLSASSPRTRTKPIWSVYRELKYQSERARYLVARFQPDEVRKLAGKLRRGETHIQELLG